MTRWADAPGTLSILLLVPAVLLALLPPHESGTPLPSNSFRREHERDDDEESEPGVAPHATAALRPLPAVSTWRAHMMLMTVLCILAVDFPVFPRALAKCETYGVSLVRPVAPGEIAMYSLCAA